jgi:hypothetical protein
VQKNTPEHPSQWQAIDLDDLIRQSAFMFSVRIPSPKASVLEAFADIADDLSQGVPLPPLTATHLQIHTYARHRLASQTEKERRYTIRLIARDVLVAAATHVASAICVAYAQRAIEDGTEAQYLPEDLEEWDGIVRSCSEAMTDAAEPFTDERLQGFGEFLYDLAANAYCEWATQMILAELGSETFRGLSDAEFISRMHTRIEEETPENWYRFTRVVVDKWAQRFAKSFLKAYDFSEKSLKEIRAFLGMKKPMERKSNRKVVMPFSADSLYLIPNIQNHGTRHLGLMATGAAIWMDGPQGGVKLAQINDATIGMIEIGVGGDDEAGKIIEALGAVTLQAMVAISKLIFEKTKGAPVNQAVTLTIREIAAAMERKPDKSRHIDSETLRRIGEATRPLTRILTWGADGKWDTKKHAYSSSGWMAPFLSITAIHAKQTTLDGDFYPYEFDAMLGRNWAEALRDRYDLIQLVPGFMKLNPSTEAQAIKLAWFYITDFRYRATKGPRKQPLGIERLCMDARIEVDKVNLSRFLTRLDGWHKRIQDLGIIGGYQRTPSPSTNWAPRQIFAEGTYQIEPPTALVSAYKDMRTKQLAVKGKRKSTAKIAGVSG